jgi:hypothetical protein
MLKYLMRYETLSLVLYDKAVSANQETLAGTLGGPSKGLGRGKGLPSVTFLDFRRFC